MPRKTYADRFEAILAKDYLASRDRSFIESLYDYYKKKRSLTVGRRRILVELEEQYAVRPKPVEGYEHLEDIKKNVDRAPADEWTRKFMESIIDQVRTGRKLTENQERALKRISKAWTTERVDKLVAEREDWEASWNEYMKARYATMVEYYSVNGYYSRLVRAFQKNPEMIPIKEDYDKLTDNKYAVKILAGIESTPLYSPGSMVSFRSTCKGYLKHKFGPAKMALVIKTDARSPVSACKGNKIYLLLAVGNSETFEVEERDIKKARV